MKKLVEAIEMLEKNGYMVETVTEYDQVSDDIDGDSYVGTNRVSFGNKEWSGNYKDWIATVHDKLLNLMVGYECDERFDEAMEDDEIISDGWIVRKWPSDVAKALFNKYKE